MATPRLAFVGPAHGASPWLLAAMARVGRFDALCDDHAERDAGRFHARWTFDDVENMLAEAEPDGVVVSASLADRSRIIRQCLSAGAGVLVLGPPGTVRDCTRVATLAKLAARPVLCAPASRFSPATLLAKRLVESGRLGRPISMLIQSTRRGGVREGEDPDAPVPVDQVFEAVDLVHHLVGPLTRSTAVGHLDGVLFATCLTVDGVPVSIACHSSGSVESVGLEYDVRASDGSALRVDRDGRLRCGTGSRIDGSHEPRLATMDPVTELGYEGLLAAFSRCLQSTSGGVVGRVAEMTKQAESILRDASRQPRGLSSRRPSAVLGAGQPV